MYLYGEGDLLLLLLSCSSLYSLFNDLLFLSGESLSLDGSLGLFLDVESGDFEEFAYYSIIKLNNKKKGFRSGLPYLVHFL